MARRRPRRPLPPRAEIYPTLDLHGRTGGEARALAARWLREQQGQGETVVRLITGRGLRSPGPPVLRGEVRALLDELRGTLVAEAVLDAAGGAFRVVLHPRPPPSRAPSAPAALLDPALHRLAEESLSDLGISPTPALVEAEMRRLLRQRGEGST